MLGWMQVGNADRHRDAQSTGSHRNSRHELHEIIETTTMMTTTYLEDGIRDDHNTICVVKHHRNREAVATLVKSGASPDAIQKTENQARRTRRVNKSPTNH